MKRVSLIGFVGSCCLVAACGSSAGQQGESVGQASSALVGKSVSIGDTVASPANKREELGNVAAGAGVYLVGWSKGDGNSTTTVFTRLSGTGEVLDPHGISFPDDGGSPDPSPWVGFDGTNFRVRNNYRLAALTPQGEWVGAVNTNQVTSFDTRNLVCMDDGNCYTLVDYFGGSKLAKRFVFFDKNNQLVESQKKIPILPQVDESNWYDLSENLVRIGNRLAYVWAGNEHQPGASDFDPNNLTKIWAAFYDPATSTVTKPLLIASAAVHDDLAPAFGVAGHDGEALFVWSEHKLSADCTAWARRIGTDGKALEDARSIALTAEECDGIDSLFYNGSYYLLGVGGQKLRPLSAAGELMDGALALGRDPANRHLDLASTADTMLLAINDRFAQDYPQDVRVFTKLFKSTGEELTAALPLESRINHMSEPAVAWNGQSYFTAWVDDRNGLGRGDLFGARVSPDGMQLDAAALPVSAQAGYSQTTPAVASSGKGYLVVDNALKDGHYEDQIQATFIDADGKAAPVTQIGYGDDQSAPAVVWNGKSYLVAWISTERRVQDLYVTRFDEKGAHVDDTWVATIAVELGGGWGPSAAATRDGLFLSWRQQAGGAERDVYGVWLSDASGKLVAKSVPKSLTGGPFVDAWVAHQDTGAACSPKVCLAVWYDASGDTKFRRFDSEGEPLGATGTLPEAVLRPLVAWDGRAFLVSSADKHVVEGYITEAGKLATPTFPLATPNEASAAAIAVDGDGHGLIVTASTNVDERFTGLFVADEVAPEANGGSGGESAVDPGTTTAGTSGVPIAGTAATSGGEATNGGENDAQAGEAGQPSAGSGGSAACAISASPQPDEGCGCSVTGGDTSRSPWLLLGLLALVLRRRRASRAPA